MVNTEKVKMSPLYLTLIRQLHQDKVEINDRKIGRLGSIDIDDHGFIDFPEFHFQGIEKGHLCKKSRFRY